MADSNSVGSARQSGGDTMSDQAQIEPADPVDDYIQTRSLELTARFTAELTEYCDKRVPALLDNAEYAAACSALLIALTRQLGRAAAAFGTANRQDPADIATMVVRMFNTNHQRSLAAIGEGETVQ